MVIEIDGNTHIDLDKDLIRQKEIEKLGIEFLRFTDNDVKNNLQGTVLIIEQKVLERMRNFEL